MVSVHLFAALLPAALLLGFMLGFAGYAQARRHAYRDFIAAQGRAGFLRHSEDCQ